MRYILRAMFTSRVVRVIESRRSVFLFFLFFLTLLWPPLTIT